MWIKQMILVVLGLSAGVAVAGGLFSFIVGLGVVSEFADRTHTGDACFFMKNPSHLEESLAICSIYFRSQFLMGRYLFRFSVYLGGFL